MSYDVWVYDKLTRKKFEKTTKDDFFDNEENSHPLTSAQRIKIIKRLIQSGYTKTHESTEKVEFMHVDHLGLKASLFQRGLYLSVSGGSEVIVNFIKQFFLGLFFLALLLLGMTFITKDFVTIISTAGLLFFVFIMSYLLFFKKEKK